MESCTVLQLILAQVGFFLFNFCKRFSNKGDSINLNYLLGSASKILNKVYSVHSQVSSFLNSHNNNDSF